jgi:hypothetical protein
MPTFTVMGKSSVLICHRERYSGQLQLFNFTALSPICEFYNCPRLG